SAPSASPLDNLEPWDVYAFHIWAPGAASLTSAWCDAVTFTDWSPPLPRERFEWWIIRATVPLPVAVPLVVRNI
ncbi:MAG: hypothetical protein WCI74_08045, partial [Actinomycetes bacterium]